ncbi:mCE-family protein Mce4F [Mycobacterium xenopi 3993]|nr:mCE-family protein Mce4F [Mycobacterium xenopi 3993]
MLVDEANAYYPQTSELIDQVGPFLQAQIRSGNDIRSLADGLARFTSEVRHADPQVRKLLTVVPARPMRPAPPSPVSDPRSRCWRPVWPTSAGLASSTTRRSSSCWWYCRHCSLRSPLPPAAYLKTREPSWTSRSTWAIRHPAIPGSFRRH